MSITSNLRSVAGFSKVGPFTEPQLRWYRFNAATNGADEFGVFRQIGRRVYIDTEAFDAWVKSGRAAQQVAA